MRRDTKCCWPVLDDCFPCDFLPARTESAGPGRQPGADGANRTGAAIAPQNQCFRQWRIWRDQM